MATKSTNLPRNGGCLGCGCTDSYLHRWKDRRVVMCAPCIQRCVRIKEQMFSQDLSWSDMTTACEYQGLQLPALFAGPGVL